LHRSIVHGILDAMDITLAVIADYANVTRDGKLNVMGVFNSLKVKSVPHIQPQIHLVWQGEAGPAEWGMQKDVEVKLLDENARQVLSIQGKLMIPAKGEAGRLSSINSIMAFNNVKFEVAGDYAFAILIGGETKRNIPLRVTVAPPPPSLPAQP
jgi:hypothetical protein